MLNRMRKLIECKAKASETTKFIQLKEEVKRIK